MNTHELSTGNWVQTKSDHRYGRIIFIKENVRKPAEIELWFPAEREKRLLTSEDVEPIPLTDEMMHSNRKSLRIPICADVILYSKNRIHASKDIDIVNVHQYQNFISACGFGDGSDFDVLVERETVSDDERESSVMQSDCVREKCTYLGANTIQDTSLYIDGHVMDIPANIKCDITYHTFRYDTGNGISTDVIQEIMLVSHIRNKESFSVLESISNDDKMFARITAATGNPNAKRPCYDLCFNIPGMCPVWIHDACVDRIFEKEHEGQTIEYTIHLHSSNTVWKM